MNSKDFVFNTDARNRLSFLARMVVCKADLSETDDAVTLVISPDAADIYAIGKVSREIEDALGDVFPNKRRLVKNQPAPTLNFTK